MGNFQQIFNAMSPPFEILARTNIRGRFHFFGTVLFFAIIILHSTEFFNVFSYRKMNLSFKRSPSGFFSVV